MLSAQQPMASPKRKSSLPNLWPLPVPLRPILGSDRDPPDFPLPPSLPPTRNAPSEDWAKPCGLAPTHIGDAGNARFWVSSANTPLPKHPRAQSGTPAPHSLRFLPESAPAPQWPSLLRTPHPRRPALWAPGPRQQREVKVPRRSRCPSLFPGEFSPLPASPGPLPLSQVSGGLGTREGGLTAQAREEGREESPSPNPEPCPLGALAPVEWSVRPLRSETSVLGGGDPLPRALGNGALR